MGWAVRGGPFRGVRRLLRHGARGVGWGRPFGSPVPPAGADLLQPRSLPEAAVRLEFAVVLAHANEGNLGCGLARLLRGLAPNPATGSHALASCPSADGRQVRAFGGTERLVNARMLPHAASPGSGFRAGLQELPDLLFGPNTSTHIKADKFLEWEEVYRDNFYGTLKAEVERIWAKKKHVIFDIDVVGGLRIKKKFPEKTLAVFVKPPSVDELKIRLKKRSTESEEKINMRIAKASVELATAPQFDKIIKNYDLEVALKEAEELVSNFLELN